MSPDKLRQGRVKCWFAEKGFGFIAPDEPSAFEVFLHSSVLKEAGMPEPREGDRIAFEPGPGRPGKGPQAVRVEPA